VVVVAAPEPQDDSMKLISRARIQVSASILLALVALAPAASTSFAAELSVGPRSGTQIIMRDGGVCDPIRHMGC